MLPKLFEEASSSVTFNFENIGSLSVRSYTRLGGSTARTWMNSIFGMLNVGEYRRFYVEKYFYVIFSACCDLSRGHVHLILT